MDLTRRTFLGALGAAGALPLLPDGEVSSIPAGAAYTLDLPPPGPPRVQCRLAPAPVGSIAIVESEGNCYVFTSRGEWVKLATREDWDRRDW